MKKENAFRNVVLNVIDTIEDEREALEALGVNVTEMQVVQVRNICQLMLNIGVTIKQAQTADKGDGND